MSESNISNDEQHIDDPIVSYKDSDNSNFNSSKNLKQVKAYGERFYHECHRCGSPQALVLNQYENIEPENLFNMGLIAGNLKTSLKTDKLLNYYDKKSRLKVVKELRSERLIGEVEKINWENYIINLEISKENLLKNKNTRRIKDFYKEQNELISKYQEIDKILDSGIHHEMIRNYSERTDYGSIPELNNNHRKNSAVPANVDLETGNLLGYNKERESKIVKFAIKFNFICNVVLLLGKLIVAILTSSISIVASLIDSALDFLSTLIIYYANKLASNRLDSGGYPIGRNRLEPLGVTIFAVIIIYSFLQVGFESLKRLIVGYDQISQIGISSIIIMSLTIIIKIICYIYCKTIKSSSIEALAQDALVDVIFNFFAIIMPMIGYFTQIWWVDPLGAICLSIYIVYLWGLTLIEHIKHLIGKEANKDDIRLILYLCLQFSSNIKSIKNLNCYYVGDSINVEVDLIIDNGNDNNSNKHEDNEEIFSSIKDSHDLAESLQYTLESLPMIQIERAFVHIDYTVDNFKGHIYK
ncbi:hypothetical protein WICMUC_001795 [Wickerhamomyces mucosus]|uniref:Cation efflux protein transmembrane domain-containing protein n=1 Tax=Wickerhamomyces mucosus TaxID=1378264 RepID=A0A9P8PTN7_9ASCO|nr:hypothetical protein WICMUC_001795 [Wickerhamomyces mucosus]